MAISGFSKAAIQLENCNKQMPIKRLQKNNKKHQKTNQKIRIIKCQNFPLVFN